MAFLCNPFDQGHKPVGKRHGTLRLGLFSESYIPYCCSTSYPTGGGLPVSSFLWLVCIFLGTRFCFLYCAASGLVVAKGFGERSLLCVGGTVCMLACWWWCTFTCVFGVSLQRKLYLEGFCAMIALYSGSLGTFVLFVVLVSASLSGGGNANSVLTVFV